MVKFNIDPALIYGEDRYKDLKHNNMLTKKNEDRDYIKNKFDVLIEELFTNEGITDKDAFKVKKSRYKKQILATNKTSTGHILFMLLKDRCLHYPRKFALRKLKKEMIQTQNEIKDLKNEISILKEMLEKTSKK